MRLVARMRAQSTSSISSIGNARVGSARQLLLVARGDRPAGDVDEEAHVADLAEHALGEIHDLVGIGQVRHERLGRRVVELRAELTQAGLVHVDDREADALPGQAPYDGLADAAGGPRHDGHAALQPGQPHRCAPHAMYPAPLTSSVTPVM